MPAVALSKVAVHLRPEDNIAVAARHLAPGTELQIDGHTTTLAARIGMGHKIALRPIKKGEAVYKYGQIIGFASEDILPGSLVHVHNLAADDFERDYAFCRDCPPPPAKAEPRTWMGYDRGDGRYGTRNYIAIISTVNCSASTSKYISERFRQTDLLKQYPNVDGVVAITHKAGCAMQYDGPDHNQLDRTLAGFAKHPNVAAYILVGLGCETGQAIHLVENQGLIQLNGSRKKPVVITVQECGGIRKTVDAGVEAIAALLPQVNEWKRTPLLADKIILGTNCGGSDGNSGVTANPALGVASDLLVAQGGTSIIGETTEIYGAEHLLTRRAVSRAVGEKLIERIKWWEWYTGIFGAVINNNPSPGNKEGGLTTIFEKSLGAIAKGGSTALVDVVDYAEPVKAKGFVVMDTPGYDPVSMTGIVAGGANVLVFTTGRGSVFGCKPAPSIKIATNTPMYEHMIDDMDVNAGVILSGTPVETVGKQIFEEILAVAGGKKTKSELNGVGEEEFAPWSMDRPFNDEPSRPLPACRSKIDDPLECSYRQSGGRHVSIQVEDYHKIYGETVAGAGVEFTVAPGEILGLVGPNGAGKTTTLRALAGILTPTQGRLLIAGHDVVLDPLNAKRELAYVPDEPQLFERLTVWEHFRFVASVYHVKDWKECAERLLVHLELTEKRHALAMELSRGMRQKVAIGCGLLHAPRAILFDEPMTGLDPLGIRTMKDLIREYAANRRGGSSPLTLPSPPSGGEGRVRGDEGAAIIISSHLLSLVEDLCVSVLIMQRGRVLRHARLADLRQELAVNGRHETLEELFFRLTGSGPTEKAPATIGEVP